MLCLKSIKKRFKVRYDAILEEKENISEAIVRQQNENDLKVAALEVELGKVKSVAALISFRFEEGKTDETDECIISVKCDGNCDHLSCRMQTMKLQGGRRTSPASTAEIKISHRCPQCGFSATTKNVLESHVQNVHAMLPTCPFCHIRFNNLGSLKKHIEFYHRESQIQDVRPSVISQNKTSNTNVSQKLCIFHLQPQGCKKGQNCDFSHETNGQQNNIVKVRKVCYNGVNCTWKPRCRYVHVEDGELLPARARREEGRRSHTPQSRNQGFAVQDVSQPPPGYSPNLSSMVVFPGLPQPSRPSVFRLNPQAQ